MDTKTRKLFAEACQARRKAYAPYSRYKVGASILDDRGLVFSGCNVENSSYGGTICAERSALCQLVAQGGKRIKAVLVVTETPGGVTPCGLCRQALIEFAPRPESVLVWIATPKKIIRRTSLGHLLPEAFHGGVFKRRKKRKTPLKKPRSR